MDASIFLAVLEKYHFYDIIIPFLLAYSMAYFALDSTKIFMKKDDDEIGRKVNIITAFSFALYLISNSYIVNALKNSIPSYMLLLLGAFSVLLLLSFAMGEEPEKMPEWIRIIFAIVFIVAVLYIYFGSIVPIEMGSVYVPSWTYELFALFIILGILGLIIKVISK